MPLELNGQRISAKDLADKLGAKEAYSKLMNNPIFYMSEALKIEKLNKSGKNTGKFKAKVPKGYELLCRFTFWDKVLEIRSEVLYYKSKQERTTNGVTKDIYIPSAISLGSEFHSPAPDIELSMFMYLSPACESSPIFDINKHTPIYVFEDRVKEAKSKLKELNQYSEIARHLDNMTPDAMPLIARGLNIQGVADMTETEIKAAIYGYAYENKSDFLNKIQAHETTLTGQILLALEKGIINKNSNGDRVAYSWNKSIKGGKHIFQSELNDSNPDRSFIAYIKENVENYYDDLMRSTKESAISNGLESFLATKFGDKDSELPKAVAEPNNLSSVVDTSSAKKYLAQRSPSKSEPSMTNGKKFSDDVAAGLINESNVDELHIGYLTKADKDLLGVTDSTEMPDITD